ncbi:hypothetical protein [Amycolatopsis plumensis]
MSRRRKGDDPPAHTTTSGPRNGPGLFHVLEDTGVGPVRERPVKE